MTYQGWIDAIARGRTVVSRVGHTQFLNLQVNGTATPGDEIRLTGPGDVQVSVEWTVTQSLARTIELVCNGVVVTNKDAQAGPGAPDTLTATVTFTNSGWLCARIMGDNGHEVHTAAVFVTVNGAPVRASTNDANFYVQWMDNLLTNTSPGGVWNSYFPTSLAAAQARYQAAKTVYQQIAAGLDVAPTVVTPLPTNAATAVPTGSSVTATFNEAVDASTVSASTFLLTDASGSTVTASVTYDAGRRRATLTPSSPARLFGDLHRNAQGRQQRHQGSRGHRAGGRLRVVIHHRGPGCDASDGEFNFTRVGRQRRGSIHHGKRHVQRGA